ncbi:sperm-associated antigen 16 protein-like [Acropora millepora]|nr:sperm-associated antigen 16 protein-like [Acropora millepora]
MADEEGAFFLEQVTVPEDSDDEFAYEEVPVEDDYSVAEGDEDLDTAFATAQETKNDDLLTQKIETEKPTATTRPEIVEDFVRNFLVKMGMVRTLDCFQTEWYELLQKGMLNEEDVRVVPDIYVKNQQLDDLVTQLRQDVAKFKEAAERAKQTFVRLKKERDFHRMHHKRVVQEKNRLITDLKRLKKHYSTYEPTLQTLKHKYEVAMKEKMLTKLERDRAVGKMTGLQTAPHQVAAIPADITQGGSESLRKVSPLRTKGAQKNATGPAPPTTQSKHPKDSEFPVDSRVNPQLSHHKGPSAHLTRSGGFRLTHTVSAHALPVSGLALHPRKQVLATVSDDWSWKMWAVPSGDIIMTGEGHKDWLSDCDFHPGGARLATSSGDGTIKIWDFSKAECVLTFTDHTHAVWGCSWHSCGDFLASCSMDNTCKVWDVNSERCRHTLRGHADSVNSIVFLPYSNTLLTCSADKTLSLWDARTGLCAQTFYGHMHSCNHVVFNHKGDTVASCDAYGVVKMWDVRSVACMTTLDLGPHPANRLDFDPSGTVLGVASNDGTVKMIEVGTGQAAELTAHEDAVQSVLFDRVGEFLVSGGSDGTFRIWS